MAAPFAPRVHVRWHEHLSDRQRADLEQRFSLVLGVRRDGPTWEYDLAEPSVEVTRALIDDANVADTHYIDRTAGTVAADAPAGTTRLRGRRVAGWLHSPLVDGLVGFWVSSLFVSAVWLARTR